ncbi:MAG: hypothetical protein ABIL00_07765 [candidate division WOR-3 bacterium]
MKIGMRNAKLVISIKRDPIKRLEKMARRYSLFYPKAKRKYLKGIADYILFVEEKVKEILERRGISVIYHFAYYAFGRKIYKLVKEKREEEIPFIIEDWVRNKGLSKEVLLEIKEALTEKLT